ncbi:transcription factor SPT20 homolog [Suncus etruscus]|uniref:transcription factor SPT20 homolog n=1 Tax=Suncus etruscus TaxID=109475 RepID=UPI00211039C3|nr:transcription factor SPT20 homolog [Suncus etruscus]
MQQQPLEQALDQAECIIERAQQRPPNRNYSSDGGKSIHEKLYEIYVEECEKEPEEIQSLKTNVNLLEKFVKREPLPCLIVNLLPGKDGYSLMLKDKNGTCSESINLPYEESELLDYLDAEQLPPILVDLLDKSHINIFYSGCIIAEIRDYRQSSNTPPGYQSRHILLQPTMQTLACDVHSMTSNSQLWSQEDKLMLESQLLLATADPLCLDPSVAVACTTNRLLYNKQKMNTHSMRRSLKRYSSSSLSRQEEMSGCLCPPELSMVNNCKRSKRSRAIPQYDLKISDGSCVDTWKQRPCDLAVPSEVAVEKYAKGRTSISKPASWPAREAKDNSGFGCKAGQQSQTTKSILMQSSNDPPFSGIKSYTEARCETPLSPAHSSTDDHSYGIKPESKMDTRSMINWPEEIASKDSLVRDSTSSGVSAGQLSQGSERVHFESMLTPSSILEKENDFYDLPMTLPSSEDSSSCNIFTPEQTRSFFCSLSPDPASEPPSPSQTSSVEVNRVQMTPAADLLTSFATSLQNSLAPSSDTSSQPTLALPTVKSSERPQATQDTANSAGPSLIKVVSLQCAAPSSVSDSNPMPALEAPANSAGPSLIKVASLQRAAPSSVSDSNPMPALISKTRAPAGKKASSKRIKAPPPRVQPSTLPQTGVQFFLKGPSGLKPVRLFQLSQGSILLKTQQETKQQQQVFQLIPSQQFPQQNYVSSAPQPVPQASTTQPSSGGQRSVVFKLNGVGCLQSQAAALAQLNLLQRRSVSNNTRQRPVPVCMATTPTTTVTVAKASVVAAAARRTTAMARRPSTISTAAAVASVTATASVATARRPSAMTSTAVAKASVTAVGLVATARATVSTAVATTSVAAKASVVTARRPSTMISTAVATTSVTATASVAVVRSPSAMVSTTVATSSVAATALVATVRRPSATIATPATDRRTITLGPRIGATVSTPPATSAIRVEPMVIKEAVAIVENHAAHSDHGAITILES